MLTYPTYLIPTQPRLERPMHRVGQLTVAGMLKGIPAGIFDATFAAHSSGPCDRTIRMALQNGVTHVLSIDGSWSLVYDTCEGLRAVDPDLIGPYAERAWESGA